MPEKTDEVVEAIMAKVKEATKPRNRDDVDLWVSTLMMYLNAKQAAENLGIELV